MGFTFISSSAADVQFNNTARNIKANRKSEDSESWAPIRRPHRGIQIKDDTYAVLSVYKANGEPIKLVSSSAKADTNGIGETDQYADFILQEIDDQREEKQQIVETFGDDFIFFFGERPRVVTFNGILLNTEDFNWRAQFWSNYERHFRGTRLVEENARVFLTYDTIILEGYPISCRASENVNDPYTVGFSMTMFLTNYQDFSGIGHTMFPDTPIDSPDIDILNQELRGVPTNGQGVLNPAQTAYRGVNASAQIRSLNYNASLNAGRGFGGFIREATKTFRNNAVTNLLSTVRAGAALILSGRTITKPDNLSGFFAQVGQAGVAQGSLSGIGDLDVETNRGQGRSVVKLRVPARTRFVEQPKLRVPIWENWDEYPLTFGAARPVPPSYIQKKAEERAGERNRVTTKNRADIAALALANQTENKIIRTVADVVNYTRTGFALVANAKAFVDDPGAVALEAAGLSGLAGESVNFGIPGLT